MTRKRQGRGEGSIFQRDDGQWVGSISLGQDGNGKRKRRTVYGATKREVQEKLRDLQTDAASGPLSDVGRLTVGEYLQRWLTGTAKNKVRASTHARYEQLIRVHVTPILGGVQLTRLSPLHVESLYAEMENNGASAWIRKMSGTVLTNALRHAVRLKLIPFNPAADVAKPQPEEKEMLFLTPEQVPSFLEAAAAYRLSALFVMAIGTGMRQGELLGLQWADLDFDKGTVAVKRTLSQLKGGFNLKEPKSRRSRRTIRMPQFVLNALHEHRKAMVAEGNVSAPVFCTKTGNFIGKSNMTRQTFKPILRKANQKILEDAEKTQTNPERVWQIFREQLR